MHKRKKWKEVKECIERDVRASRDPRKSCRRPEMQSLMGNFPSDIQAADAAVRADLQGESARKQRAEPVPFLRGLAFV